MRPASIRLRLTLWYFGIVAATFAVYAIGILLAMRASVDAVIDEELRTRLQGVQRYMARHDPAVSLEDLQGELREHSGLRPGGDLLQVSNAQGQWLFRSTSIREYAIGRTGDGPKRGALRDRERQRAATARAVGQVRGRGQHLHGAIGRTGR